MKSPQTSLGSQHRPARRAMMAGTAAFLCLLLPDRGVALDPARDMLQYNCQTWSRQTGLPANGINAITQTKDGYLWLGTQSGLVRFDGVQFSVVNLPEGPRFRSQVISSLASSRDDGLWFGIIGGSFGFYNGQGGFSSPNDATWADPGMNVISLREIADGSLWVGTDKGVARYVKGNPRATVFDDRPQGVRGISEDSQRRVWLPTAQKGLYYWQAGKIIPFPDDSLQGETISAAVADLQGQIWVGTPAGLRCYDAAFRRKEIPPFTKEARTLLVDRQGVVWIGTVGDGLACYKDGAFSFFRQSDGLADNLVTSLFEDREGSLWIGTQGGLSQFTDVKFPIYSAAEGLPAGLCHGVSVSANGGLWIATSHGVSHFDGKKATNYTTENGLSSSYIKRAFEARNGDVYLINGKMGIDVLAEGKVVATFPNKSWPTAMAEDSQGVVVAVADRLFRVSRTGLVPYVFKDRQAPAVTWIRNLLTSRDGTLWVATVKGILRVQEGAVRQWSTATGLSDNDVRVLCEDDDGVIWAGLTTGLARIKGDQVRNINRRDGLWDDSIFAIVPDDQGHFWINSSRGIFRVNQQDLNAFADGKIGRVESVAYDGMNAVKTIDTAEVEYVGCKTSDGRIWFPTPLGAVAIDPAHIPVNQIAPTVNIESVRANAQNLTGHHRQVVPPGPGELEFHFTAPSFIVPQKVRFRYRLEGYDQGWVETENRRQAYYTNLKPGRYTFRVTAANADGTWYQSGDALAIELRPHFIQTIWFDLLCGGLALSVLMGGYRWRVRILKRKEQALQENRILLETEVRNRTADLQSEIAERKRAEAELANSLSVLHATLESAIDGILVVDLKGQLTAFNRTFTEMWHIPREGLDTRNDEQALGMVIDQLKEPESFRRKVRELYARPEAESFDLLELKDERTFERYSQPQRVGQAIVGRVWVFRDITSRKQAEDKLADTHQQLVNASRQAGMAEIATSVLHNVGNVLNSVNVSATLAVDQVRHTKAVNIAKLATLFDQHKADLAGFLTNDSRGQTIHAYLGTLAEALAVEQKTLITELDHLRENVEHIKDIVAMQQSYAQISGVIETISVPDLIEEALRINADALTRHHVTTIRDFQACPAVTTDRHKVMQILINLVRNAKLACVESGRTDKQLTVRTTSDDRSVKIAIIDNGVGIPAENLTRIFNHGFTTRKTGHGFALHSGALAARELGGSLTVHSDGPGHGATFILELPRQPDPPAHENSVQ